MFKRKNIKSKIITSITVFMLMISQTLSVFADTVILPGMENTGEIPTQTEATMWLEEKGNKWYTEPTETGENSAIYTTETLHTTCRAYHTIGYVLFLGKEGCSQNFSANSIDSDIEPLFYSPEEGEDAVSGKYKTNTVKYINLKEVGEKFEKENPGLNPYTRRLFMSPIVTYRNYTAPNVKADDALNNYADLITQKKKSDDEIYELKDVLKNINDFYYYNGVKFDDVYYRRTVKKGGELSANLAAAAFYADISKYLSDFQMLTLENYINSIGGKNVFAAYSECLIKSLPKNKEVQSFAPGYKPPTVKIDDIQYDEPNTSNVPIITSTEYPGTHADITGMPIPDSAIAINGEYYFGNKPEQADYDWSEKGGGYIPVTENITASVKADNWIGQSQFAQCHDTAVFRVYFKIKYTKPRYKRHRPSGGEWKYTDYTYNMYVDVPRDVYYWKLYSFSGYKLTNITLTNGAYPDKTITFDFDPPMSEDHTYYNGATSKYITNNVDWTGIGYNSVVTIDVTDHHSEGSANHKNEGIAKARATATNYVGYPTAWNDAFSITTDAKTLTYLTDDKVKMSRSKNRTATPKHYTEWDQDYISDEDTVTIPPTVANGYYGTTIQRTYTKFAEFNAKEMDAMTFYAEKDIKSSNASPSISSGSYAKTRQSVNYEHILRDDPK